jgi:branched-subunit amino acid transport protein AzlD
MWHSYVFGMLLSIASMLFVFNGAVYFRIEREKSALNLSKYGKWYNVVLGLSLLMVVCLPWRQFGCYHFTFATIFFFGNAVVTGIFHQKRNGRLSIVLAVLTVVALIIYMLKLFPDFSLLAAEWISLTVVGIHFYLESR